MRGLLLSMKTRIRIIAVKWLLLCAVPAILFGCAGGGGSIHIPPKSIHAGQATVLELKLSTWGYGFGKIVKRYTDVLCHYRLSGQTNFTSAVFVPVREEDNSQVYSCNLPVFTNIGQQVEYFIDMKFDGVYNQRALVSVKIE